MSASGLGRVKTAQLIILDRTPLKSRSADLPVGRAFRIRVKPGREKYFAFSEAQITCMFHAIPRLIQRGASRSSRTSVRVAMDAGHID
jgi:hypothetical protein